MRKPRLLPAAIPGLAAILGAFLVVLLFGAGEGTARGAEDPPGASGQTPGRSSGPRTKQSAGQSSSARPRHTRRSTRLSSFGEEDSTLNASRHSTFHTSYHPSVPVTHRVRAELLSLQTWLDPASSVSNPDNVLGLPGYETGLELRPDLEAETGRVSVMLKPRAAIRWGCPLEGIRDRAWQRRDSLYLNEGRLRVRVVDPLFVSWGRENLQWGPSQLLSVSNPFHAGNGRELPYREEPGLEYGRAVWIPGYRFSLSLVANTGRGAAEAPGGFARRYCLKADYTGNGRYVSGILSTGEAGADRRIAGFGGITVSDPFLLHAEGSYRTDPGTFDLLAGGTYTLSGGTTFTVEGFRQGAPAESGPAAGLVPASSGARPSAALRALSGRGYLLLQASHPDAWGRLLLSGRWVLNLDDRSQRAVGFAEYGLGRNARVFLAGTTERGEQGDELGDLVNGWVTLGASLIY